MAQLPCPLHTLCTFGAGRGRSNACKLLIRSALRRKQSALRGEHDFALKFYRAFGYVARER